MCYRERMRLDAAAAALAATTADRDARLALDAARDEADDARAADMLMEAASSAPPCPERDAALEAVDAMASALSALAHDGETVGRVYVARDPSGRVVLEKGAADLRLPRHRDRASLERYLGGHVVGGELAIGRARLADGSFLAVTRAAVDGFDGRWYAAKDDGELRLLVCTGVIADAVTLAALCVAWEAGGRR